MLQIAVVVVGALGNGHERDFECPVTVAADGRCRRFDDRANSYNSVTAGFLPAADSCLTP
jgi:hypothetical protein